MKLILRGVAAGLVLAALIALADLIWYRGYLFGLVTLIIGMVTGGAALLTGFLMAVAAYLLASRGTAPVLRRRLILAAVFTGAAGLTLSLAVVGLWAVAGQPFFP